MAKFTPSEYDAEKTSEVLLYLSGRIPKFDQYKACKVLFLSDKRHLVKYARTITGDNYAALELGPIPSSTRDRIKTLLEKGSEDHDLGSVFSLDVSFRYPRLVPLRAPDQRYLSDSEREALEETIAEFGSKSFDELKALTHEMAAYKKAWKDGQETKSFPMKFEDFFEQDENAVEGALEEMRENTQLRRTFVRL